MKYVIIIVSEWRSYKMNERNKKIILGIVIAIGVILLCALCYFASSATTNKAGDSYQESDTNSSGSSSVEDMTSRAQEESANVSEDEKKDFEDIDVDTYLDLYKGDEKAIVLFSRPTCGFCQIAEPILQHISYQYDLTINHINTDEMDSDDSTNLVESNDYFSDGLGTPLLMVVSNGEIVDVVSGLVDTASYVGFFTDNGFIKE